MNRAILGLVSSGLLGGHLTGAPLARFAAAVCKPQATRSLQGHSQSAFDTLRDQYPLKKYVQCLFHYSQIA